MIILPYPNDPTPPEYLDDEAWVEQYIDDEDEQDEDEVEEWLSNTLITLLGE